MMPADKKINWEILSLTRFLLALIVMTGHLSGFTDIGFLKWYSSLGSFEAILGFLLISGFSIGKSIKRDKANYFKRRLQRIYPVYIVSIIFQVIVTGVFLNLQSSSIIVLNLFFLNQLFISYSLVGPAWTLSTEVWLYSLAPLLLKLTNKNLSLIIYCSFFTYIVYTCGRTLYHWDYYSTTNYGINLFLLSFIWIAGFKLAVLPKNRKQNNFIILTLFCGHIALTGGIQVLYRLKNQQVSQIFSTDFISFIGNSICLFLVYVVVIFNNRISFFSDGIKKIFNLLGNISYPLYLSHLTTFEMFKKMKISSCPVLFFSALCISYVFYVVFDFYSKKRVSKYHLRLLPSNILIRQNECNSEKNI